MAKFIPKHNEFNQVSHIYFQKLDKLSFQKNKATWYNEQQ